MAERCIDEKHVQKEFVELTAIDSVSYRERVMAERLKEKLQEIGCTVVEDEAGAAVGGEAGNLYGFLHGNLPGPPILLTAHMDTVQPGYGKQALDSEDGRIISAGNTVLGADDVAGIVEILEGIRSVRRACQPHRDIEILFSVAEEAYSKGAGALDYSMIQAKEAYTLDMSGDVGSAAVQAPSIISFVVTVEGKAAHAGFEPENGIHAITLMSQAISRICQGHVDEDTTVNVGMISGGSATNIVPEQCICRGEIRSYHHAKALEAIERIRAIFEETLAGSGAKYKLGTEIHFEAYKISESDPVVLRFQRACKRLGLEGKTESTFGGSDNNHLMQHGIKGIVLSCGMYKVHSVREYTTITQLVNGASLVAELITTPLSEIQSDYNR